MAKWAVRTTMWVCLAASFWLAEPKADASTFLDWLHGRDTNETVACYPTCCYDPCVVYDPCMQYQPCNPCVTQPVPQPQAVVPNWGTSPMVQPARPAVNPIPQTYYKTNWEKVPVTRYRPVVYSDPATGYPLTVMDPCTTYTWMPERRRQSFLSRLFHGPDPPPNAVVPQATQGCPPCYSPVMPNCGMPAAPSCCTPSTMVPGLTGSKAPAPIPASPAPYYPTGPSSTPIVPGPPTATIPGSTVVPPAGVRQVPSTQPAVPADVKPHLKPNVVPDSKPTAPANQPASHTSAMTALPWGIGHGSILEYPAHRSLAAEPPVASPSPTPRSGNVKLRPVPDPDATPNPTKSKSAPVLLNPRDRTAIVRPVRPGSYTAIAWPSHTAMVPVTARRQTTRPARSNQGRDATRYTPSWDDSGWKTIRP